MWVKTLQERHAFNELALELKAVRNIGSGRVFVMLPVFSSINVKMLNGFYSLHGGFSIPLWIAFAKWV
ncbi:hypothetical protein [Bartonella sp. CR84HXZ]|uniref:hypothetical protein n=1 Tax=Bartonella sp. CR84HXZ TaxID=1460997 RepID=UPI0035CEA087